MSLTPFKKIDRLSRDPMANSLGACVVIKSSNSILSLKQKFLKFSYVALQHQKSKNVESDIPSYIRVCVHCIYMRTLHIHCMCLYIDYNIYIRSFLYSCLHSNWSCVAFVQSKWLLGCHSLWLFVVIISRFLQLPKKWSWGNQLIHRYSVKTKSIVRQDPKDDADRRSDDCHA